MDKQMKKRIKKYTTWVLLVAMVALLAAMPLLASQKQVEDGPRASILTGKVTRGDIQTHLMGGGVLSAQKPETVTVPLGVKLTEYLVKNGDDVKQGDPIAKVDRISVMTAITQAQENLEELADQLEDIRNDTEESTVKAVARGTVKVVHGKEGDDVQSVMLEHGALAVLSLDGLMAVQIPQLTALAGGDTVTVTFEDGREVEGRVESNLEGILTVTVKDDGYAPGETVSVSTPEGDAIGSGSLYIHSQWNAIAYSGRIAKVSVDPEDTVTPGKVLFTLEETDRTAEFDTLSAQHREASDKMLELFKMYQTETLVAPCDGIVMGVMENAPFMLASADGNWQVELLANEPNGEENASYVNFVGTVFAVGLDGLVLKMNPQPLSVADYADLSAVPLDTALMTEDVSYSGQAPIFEWAQEEWIQVDPATVLPGDVLLFAGDAQGNFVWVIRMVHAEPVPEETLPTEPAETQPTEPAETKPTEPETPDETKPTEPTEPDTEEDPTMPTFPNQGQFPQIPSFDNNIFGGWAGQIPEQSEEETLQPESITVAMVTPRDTLQLQITVDELDIGFVSLGQKANVTLDALKGRDFAAEVTEISGTGQNSGGNSKFTVTLTLKAEGEMLPGMTASASIALDREEDVLVVPVAALAQIKEQTVLYTRYDPETESLLDPVVVTTGISDGEFVQILSGVEEGMEFSYAYYDTLVISQTPDKSFIPSFE